MLLCEFLGYFPSACGKGEQQCHVQVNGLNLCTVMDRLNNGIMIQYNSVGL